MQQLRQSVAVWLREGIPNRLVWKGARYRVTDRPTPLEEALYEITHPPTSVSGWRFQGTAEDGSTHVFDIRQEGDDWILVQIYD